jgi:diamine N-acetyltransferase
MIPVTKAGIESIPVIQALAEKTWKAAYTSVLSAGQMKYMLDLFYSEEALKKQMEEGHKFVIAREKTNIIGFASYSVKSMHEPSTYRLHKLNIDPAYQGKGIGTLLIGFIINDITKQDAVNLELNLNRHHAALEFYQKIGFKIIKEEDINIGNGFFLNDYVMNLSLHIYS